MTDFPTFEDALRSSNNYFYYSSGRFAGFTPFTPLAAEEFRNLTQEENLLALSEEQLERLWLKPVSRWLQVRFRIDQQAYAATTDPTLAELTEDFKIAVALTVDKLSRNEDGAFGQVNVAGVGSKSWDNMIPDRARAILQRYMITGGQIRRS